MVKMSRKDPHRSANEKKVERQWLDESQKQNIEWKKSSYRIHVV